MNVLPTKPVLFTVGLLVLGASTIIWQASRTIRSTRQLLKYAQIPLTSELEAQIAGFGLNPVWFILIQFPQPLTFCFGFFRPRICLSTGLVELLTQPQLQAALLHEEYHRQHFDPLRLLLAEALGTALFFLPVAREWRAIFKLELELNADQYAVNETGKAALAGALHRLLSYGAIPAPLATAITAGLSANSLRIAALLGERSSALPKVSRRTLLSSAVILLMICLVF